MHHMAEGRFIAYHRVSTAQQGRSGLGLEAQRQAVADYLDGGAWTLVAEYTEVESGTRADRPELAKALAACRAHRAVLASDRDAVRFGHLRLEPRLHVLSGTRRQEETTH